MLKGIVFVGSSKIVLIMNCLKYVVLVFLKYVSQTRKNRRKHQVEGSNGLSSVLWN